MTRYLLLALASCTAQPAAAQGYGPPDVIAATADSPHRFRMPDRFTVEEGETLADAEAKVTRQRADATRWMIAGLAMSAADAVITDSCLRKNVCTEVNPIYGSRPSTAKLFGMKAGIGAMQWLYFTHLRRKNPAAARSYARTTLVVNAGLVAFNFQHVF
jgi:hypothetical protein